MTIAEDTAKAALDIKAIKLSPSDPFTWASGYRMPIYNDNRMFLFYPQYRELIRIGFCELLDMDEISFDVIAGTSTSGIPPATTLADHTGHSLIYVRDKPKGHGLQNQIEGIDAHSDLKGYGVLLIEDLISTGGSSVQAVQAVRDANGTCYDCFSIFSYGFDKAQDMFAGKEPYDKAGNRLETPCDVQSILTYDTLLDVAKETGYITPKEIDVLSEWRDCLLYTLTLPTSG